MRGPVRVIVFAALLGSGFLAGSLFTGRSRSSAVSHRTPVKYVCPMHPEFVSDKPGDAPCCGMRLEPVYADGSGPGAAAVLPPGHVRIGAEKQQLIGVRTAAAAYGGATDRLRLSGRVTLDENRVFPLTLRVDGTVRSVFPEATTGAFVKKGQHLLTVYSYDFISAQQAYFAALEARDRIARMGGPDNPDQVQARILNGRYELENAGFTESQIEEITKRRWPATTVTLAAPADAYVVTRSVYPNSRFERGSELFRLADLSRVWVLADVFPGDAKYIEAGRRATVSLPGDGQAFPAVVSEALPRFDANTRTLQVRLEVNNPRAFLRPDMFVDVQFAIKLPRGLTVPANAVVDSGLLKTVYVDRGGGRFEPRSVETGWRRGELVEITKGLRHGEIVVVDGNFLIDSESRMKLALASASAARPKDPVCGMDADPAKGIRSEHEGKTYYLCSESCKRKFDAEPAKYVKQEKTAVDPVCGMSVEIAEAAATSAHKGRTYYFCSDGCNRKFEADPEKYARRLR